MKKHSKGIIFILFLTSIVIPFFPITAKAQVTEVFIVGGCGPRDIAHWDSPTAVVSTGDYYVLSCLETLFRPRIQTWGGDTRTELYPVLATSWVIEERPDEWNVDGFKNYDGMKSVEITLRQNVKFHDGSDWNATVCKWNIDRLMTIIGNISGITPVVDSNMATRRDTYWLEQGDWAAYETAGWNVTQYAGKPGEYPGFGTSTEDAMEGRWPRFYNVTVTENLQSGGKVKVNFGDWATGMDYLWAIYMISMHSYKDYATTAIKGYGNDPAFPQGNPAVFPGHLIGTGPYVFEAHIADIGTLHRFDDWWNATAQQADGWFEVENVALAAFAHTEAGYQARSTAMVTGDIDFSYDRTWEPLNYEDMIAAPDVRYVPIGIESYGENIILNCINETTMWYHANVWYTNFSTIYGPPTVTPYWPGPQFKASGVLNSDWTLNAHGINRAFRKALSYVFDYDTYVHVAQNDRVVRSGGFLCTTNPYRNASINIATRDLTIARGALLNDTDHWGAVCAARGLTVANDTADWHYIADTNPIYTMEYSYDQAHLEAYSVLKTSLRDIGCQMDEWEDVPDTYYKMSATFTFPWTITDGFALKLGYTRVANLGYLQAYYKSPITIWPYDQFYNMGFCYNTTFDDAIKKIWFQNDTEVQKSYNFLSDWIQNYQYPTMYLANDKMGHAIDKDWDYGWFWGNFRYNLVKFIGGEDERPLIPGFSISVILPVGLMATLGIGYTIIRKKKRV
ncbi:MAG: ABC transporter substrate-binding protein [Candidatus Hermodarchaeota archaeon]